MRVLVACEFSGTVRDAFLKKGHDAISCDVIDTDVHGPHYKGDVRDIDLTQFDLMIAHPPCTFLANSGVQWLHKKEGRWEQMLESIELFNYLLRAPINKKCIENPIPHKYARDLLIKQYDQIVQPWMFGHTENKKTCLWLEGLDPLKPTNDVREAMKHMTYAEKNKIHHMPDTKRRQKLRSKTYQGIAEAMADQWG